MQKGVNLFTEALKKSSLDINLEPEKKDGEYDLDYLSQISKLLKNKVFLKEMELAYLECNNTIRIKDYYEQGLGALVRLDSLMERWNELVKIHEELKEIPQQIEEQTDTLII